MKCLQILWFFTVGIMLFASVWIFIHIYLLIKNIYERLRKNLF